MGVFSTILLVLFIIIGFLVIFIVAIQDEESDGLSAFGSSAQSTFGSHTSSVVTKATAVLGAAFMIVALCIAMVNSTSSKDTLLNSVETQQVQQSQTWWVDSSAK
ncbi:MAG: preprotein translocase subunit SecG [Spirochaetia bacterium]|jgi:preprotein translocase subunit SecG|nr:preprotein translocase subunit SecG [Spirochaetia bacterium]